jgi:hypothetical protein
MIEGDCFLVKTLKVLSGNWLNWTGVGACS